MGLHEDRITVGQIDNQEVDLAFRPANHRQSLTKVSLGMTGRMMQRHKHFPGVPAHFADVILHNADRVKTLGSGDGGLGDHDSR